MLVKRHSHYLPTLVNDFWGEDLFPGFEQNWSLTPAVNIIEGVQDFIAFPYIKYCIHIL